MVSESQLFLINDRSLTRSLFVSSLFQGKTRMIITFLDSLMRSKIICNALIVAPLAVQRSWEKEAYRVMASAAVNIEVIASSDSQRLRLSVLRNALRW